MPSINNFYACHPDDGIRCLNQQKKELRGSIAVLGPSSPLVVLIDQRITSTDAIKLLKEAIDYVKRDSAHFAQSRNFNEPNSLRRKKRP